MYAQTTIAGLAVPLINPQQVPQNFNFSANTPDPELNGFTPQVATAAATLIISAAANQHPLRVNALNVLGQNGFVNNEFRTFITHVMRISLAMFEQQQITSISQVINGKLSEFVQMISSVVAMHNPSVVQMLDQQTHVFVQQSAQAWFAMVQKAEAIIAEVARQRGGMGAMQQMPAYGAMQQSQGFTMPNQPYGSPVQGGVQLNQYGTNFGSSGNTGAFVSAQQTQTQYPSPTSIPSSGNTVVGGGNRYQRKLMEEQQQRNAQALAGYEHERGVSVMQQPQQQVQHTAPLQHTPAATAPVRTGAGLSYAERLKAEMEQVSVGQMPAKAADTILQRQVEAVQQANSTPNDAMTSFQQQVQQLGHEPVFIEPAHQSTVYERGELDASAFAEPVAQKAHSIEQVLSKVEKKEVLKEFVLNGHTFRMTAMLVDTSFKDSGWKPSRFQSHFPAWCRRTHEIAYCISDENIVVAIALPLSEEKVNEMFEYEAHAIDPTKGLPSEPIAVPVREEAKVLYSQELEPVVNIRVREEELTATSDEDLVQQTLVEGAIAFEKEADLSYHASVGTVMSAVTAATAETAQRLYNQVRDVYLQVSFAAAAQKIKAIELPSLRRRVDRIYTEALNDVLAIQLGLDAAVDSFMEEAPTIIEDVHEEFGRTFSVALTELQSDFVASTCDAQLPVEVESHHEDLVDAQADGEDVTGITSTMFYLSHKSAVMVSRYTEDELAIGLAPYGACQLQQDTYPSLYAAIRAYFESNHGKQAKIRTLHLLSIDGKAYRVCQSPLNPIVFLIMEA